jgi:hypothetical protein
MRVIKETKFVVELDPADVINLREEIELVYPLFASENDVEDIHHLLEFKNELVLADENY